MRLNASAPQNKCVSSAHETHRKKTFVGDAELGVNVDERSPQAMNRLFSCSKCGLIEDNLITVYCGSFTRVFSSYEDMNLVYTMNVSSTTLPNYSISS